MATRFDEYPVVFLGKIVSLHGEKGRDGRPYEDAVFTVLKAWKGTKAGERLAFHTMIVSGLCGISIGQLADILRGPRGELGPPPSPLPDYEKPLPAMAQTWVIFAGRGKPQGLFQCSGSRPVDVVAAKDISWLNAHAEAR